MNQLAARVSDTLKIELMPFIVSLVTGSFSVQPFRRLFMEVFVPVTSPTPKLKLCCADRWRLPITRHRCAPIPMSTFSALENWLLHYPLWQLNSRCYTLQSEIWFSESRCVRFSLVVCYGRATSSSRPKHGSDVTNVLLTEFFMHFWIQYKIP